MQSGSHPCIIASCTAIDHIVTHIKILRIFQDMLFSNIGARSEPPKESEKNQTIDDTDAPTKISTTSLMLQINAMSQ